MVQPENIDSGCSGFQLDDRSRRDHHSLAHLSKFPLGEARTHPPRLIARETAGSQTWCRWRQAKMRKVEKYPRLRPQVSG